MSCKDCIHYEVCQDHYIPSVLDYINGSCINFENKSEWVHLPCKVVDTVYIINRANKAQEMIFDLIDLRCTCVNDTDCMCGSLCNDIGHNACQYRFKNDFSDVGKTVFLTYEEAEKALKEREKSV